MPLQGPLLEHPHQLIFRMERPMATPAWLKRHMGRHLCTERAAPAQRAPREAPSI